MAETCNNGEYFHFQLSFYSDPDYENLLGVVDSQTEWYNFYGNGTQFSSKGIYVCEEDCVDIEYKVPFDAPSWMFNRQLYVKISKPFRTFDASIDGGSAQAAIVICIDQSGSMTAEVNWLPQMITSLESKLVERGIGGNLWGLVGFGGSEEDSAAFVHYFNESEVYGSAQQLADYISAGNLLPLGGLGSGIEDGYEAINTVFQEFPIPDEVPLNIILVTDEDRDARVLNLNKTGITQYLTQSKTTLSVVVNYSFKSNDGRAIGVTQDGIAYVADGSGSFIASDGGEAGAGYGSTFADYIDLAWSVGGVAWDMNLLRTGGETAESFKTAFTEGMLVEINESFICFDSVTPETFEFLCVRKENSDLPVVVKNERDSAACLHAKITFYADADRQSVVLSSFTMLDQRRWFVVDNAPCRFSPSGTVVGAHQTVNLFYKPDVLPIDQIENQPEFAVFGGQFEKPLICGVKYYVTVEAYWADSNQFEIINEYEWLAPCSQTTDSVRVDFDADNWISSGQGRFDVRVSETRDQCLFPSVAGTLDGKYMISWQDYRDTTNSQRPFSFSSNIYYGIYDRDQDVFWSSGQGNTDTMAVSNAIKPFSFKDASDNFILLSPNNDTVKLWKCILADAAESGSVTEPSTSVDNQNVVVSGALRDPEQYLKARVYSEDLKGSFVIGDGVTVALVEDYIIRLEVSGLTGAYAVRLRNEDDKDWTAWINIDNDLQSGDVEYDDAFLSAYRIDEDRFIIPWVLACCTGLKRVCLQVLTYSGVSKTFCCEIFANIRDLEYFVDLSYTSDFTSLVPTYNGRYVISHGDAANGRTVYVRVKFADKDKLSDYLNKLSAWSRYSYLLDGMTFNVIQQGIDDQTKLPLSVTSDPSVYTGSFIVKKSDGVFNKDGLAAITVSLPTPSSSRSDIISCGSDTSDPYNRADVVLIKELSRLGGTIQDIAVDAALSSAATSPSKPPRTIVQLLQSYSADDPRFSFGNPDIYRKKI